MPNAQKLSPFSPPEADAQEHEEEQRVDGEVHGRAAEGGAHLPFDVDAAAQAGDGPVAGPGVPEGEAQGGEAEGVGVRGGAEGEEEADEAGEEDEAAVALEDEPGRGGQGGELPVRAEGEGQACGEGDGVVEEEGEL